MIQISFLFIYLILIAVWIVYRIIVHKKVKRISVFRELFINIFFVYFLVVVSYTIFKMGWIEINFDDYGYANLVPLKETIKMFKGNGSGVRRGLYNVVGNILLFVPFGFLIPLLFDRYNNILKVTFYGLIASLAIEVIQYFTAMNITDIDDVIFNTFGAVVGIICYKIFSLIVKTVKLNLIIDKIKDYRKTNILLLIIKPFSAMVLCCGIFIVYSIYASTYSNKLSNEQFVVEAFARYENQKEFVAAKDFDRYKLFLRDNDKYWELATFEKGFMNRYAPGRRNFQASLNSSKFGYKVETLDKLNEKSIGVIVFGRNDAAKSIIITFKGKEYKEDLNASEYFIVAHPEFKELTLRSDIYNIYNNKPSKDLQIRFLDEKGAEYTGMGLIK